MNGTKTDVVVGMRARFFHPKTLGVMHYGKVIEIGKKFIKVHFDIDDKKYWTHPDYISKT